MPLHACIKASVCFLDVLKRDVPRVLPGAPFACNVHCMTGRLGLFKNLFMLSVRISSYRCTRKVWRARKMLAS